MGRSLYLRRQRTKALNASVNRESGGGCCAPFREGAGSSTDTMWPSPIPTTLPSGILIHPAVWPQQTGPRFIRALISAQSVKG